MAKSWVMGEGANLYDPDTGAFVGVVDKNGVERLIPTMQQNQLTGRSEKIISGNDEIGVPIQSARRVSHHRPVGNMSLSATALITRHGAWVLPGVQWDAYRLRIHSGHTSAIDYKAAVLTQSAIGDGFYNAATWDKPTFNGSLTATVPAANVVPPQSIEGYIDSDVMFSSSADYNGGTILAARTYCAVASNTRFDPPGGVTGGSLTSNGFVSAYLTNVDAVTDTTLFTGYTSVNALPPISIIGYSSKQIKKIGTFGASTLSGQADTVQLGWAFRAQNAMSDVTRCYQFVNNSVPSSKTSTCLNRFLAKVAAGDVFDAAIFSIFSTNDSTDADYGTAAYLNRLKGQIILFIDTCRKYGIQPWLATFQYPTGMTGTAYAQCKAINAYARSLSAAGCFDIAGLFSDETASTGTWKDPSNTSDGTHPNTAGTLLLQALAQTTFA